MSLGLEGIARLGIISLTALVACSESDSPGGGGSAGSSGSSAGGGGNSSAGTGTAGSSAGTGGSTAGGGASSTAGSATAGGGATSGSGGAGGGAGGAKSKTTFFVTSDTSSTGNLGGLAGADMRCQTLAQAAGFGDHTWKAYLSTSTVNAKDRIGTGPWVNAKGVTLAENLSALHALKGNADLFLDEKGMKVNGQWANSPDPNEHDILTGSNADGTVYPDRTCMDWTSSAAGVKGQVGHSDGMGPDMATTGTYSSWNSSHDNQDCSNTAPRGGAGKIYCFAVD